MISVNQTLHGYAMGHKMLATSCDWTLDERKKLDVLSDLNGQCNAQDFKDYYTGYPITGGKQYVIAKTWYAAEMERSGCVWTHSIILSIEQISQIQSISELLQLFVRPLKNDFNNYKQVLQLKAESLDFSSRIDKELLKYYIYTIYGSSKSKLVYFEENEQEDAETFLTCLRFMPKELLKEFSFCTMSYEMRTYEGFDFSYQITTKERAFLMKLRNAEFKLCPLFRTVERYPFWVSMFLQCMYNNNTEDIQNYISLYGKENLNWKEYNGFLRLYFSLLNRDDLCLRDYFEFLSFVFPKNKDRLIQDTVYLILEKKFYIYKFVDVIYEILEILGIKKFKLKLNKTHKNNLIQQYLNSDLKKIYPILLKYKEGKLNGKQKKIIEETVSVIKPNDLKNISQMEEDLCVVLVRINPELLLSPDIWRLNRDFQIMLLYAGGKDIDFQLFSRLIETIFFTNNENIVEECYRLYGNRLFTAILDILKKDSSYTEKKIVKWFPVLMEQQEDIINALEDIPSDKVCKMLFFTINKRNRKLLQQISLDKWNGLYKRILEKEKDENERKKLSLEFLIIIFSVEYSFDISIVKEVVEPIYNELCRDMLPINEWNSFQYLLPQVELCYSWDKCRRVREALNFHGYFISGINTNIKK